MNETALPRDVGRLIEWLRECTPGTLIPAGDLLERVKALPVASGAVRPEEVEEEPQQLLTADQVANWLQLNVQSVYRLAREGRLRKVQVGDNTVRFRHADVERWLDRRAS